MMTCGIIGGIGPFATLDLFRCVLSVTPSKTDGDHVPLLIDNATGIAAALENGGSMDDEFYRGLADSALRLEAAGADFIAIACNTAHHYLPQLSQLVHIPILDMPALTAQHCTHAGFKRLGLLATPSTLKFNIYQNAFSGTGIELITPLESDMAAIRDIIINGVKAGKRTFDAASMQAALDSMSARGAEAFILGCTELPEAFSMYALTANTVDPSLLLAEAIVARSKA